VTTTARTRQAVERSIFAPVHCATSGGSLILVTLIALEVVAVAGLGVAVAGRARPAAPVVSAVR
jgi:hypothetical protein